MRGITLSQYKMVRKGKNSFLNGWKGKNSLNTKIFIWPVLQDKYLTTDNLVVRNWHGDESCASIKRKNHGSFTL